MIKSRLWGAVVVQLSQCASGIADLVYPRACVACGRNEPRESMHICWNCLSSLRLIVDRYCEVCGDPAEGILDGPFRCGWCMKSPPLFERARSAVRYRGPIREAMREFKYGDAIGVARDFTDLLEAVVSGHYRNVAFDEVMAVPLHVVRERERSYNQSRLLAEQLARSLGIPHRQSGLKRTRWTGTQTHLTAQKRRRNVKGAFQVVCPEWIDGRRILLVDDVMTTGATVNECARCLRASGAAGVWVVTVARG
jgi:competence protein ComFC